jgi:hypothetical protein
MARRRCVDGRVKPGHDARPRTCLPAPLLGSRAESAHLADKRFAGLAPPAAPAIPTDRRRNAAPACEGELTRSGRVRNPSPGRAPSGMPSKGLTMTFVWRAALVMCIIFAGCMAGILLQHSLPTEHLAAAKSAITTIQGLVALLLALVLGLLVWTSYGVYSQQQSETHTLGSQVLQLDLALERYGPGAVHGRELLRQELMATRKRFWGGGGARPARLAYSQSRAELRDFDGFFAALKPSDDEQRYQLDKGRQLSASIIQTHYLMSRQLLSPIPKALLISVVCWATLLFTCIGASSGVNALAIVYEALGAAAVASAIYLILEFSQPYLGLFRISSEGVDQVIAELSANKPCGG